jgi:cytoskeletal protein CcmA (bactofilin family)
MFSNKKVDTTPKYDQVDTLIGKNTVFRGNMDAEGTIRIEGNLEGELNIKGDIVLADKGKVTGNIIGTNAHIAGRIEGNIKVASQLHLTPTSYIDGDIEVGNLVVDEGAVFTGKCTMGSTTAQSADGLKSDTKFNTKHAAE